MNCDACRRLFESLNEIFGPGVSGRIIVRDGDELVTGIVGVASEACQDGVIDCVCAE